LIDLKSKLIFLFLVGGFLLGCIFSFINAINKISELRAEIKQLQTELKQCQDTNQELLSQVQIQKDEYNKALKEIQEASIKPVKRVYIKQTIKEPIYISNQDCQQMVDLIRQAQEQLK
jgi:septal ring factor EnvC (AmiA/AmiB activator)